MLYYGDNFWGQNVVVNIDRWFNGGGEGTFDG